MDNKQKITTDIKVPNKNMEVLKKHFGQCFDKNGNFDIEKFKQELSENEIDFYKESYDLDWLGKSYARILASDEATTLLKEDEEHNQKDENKNSQNLLIKGDNLEVLKHLSNAYYEKIKMIYIDPPYNTGSDGFVYQDDRKFTVDELKLLAGVDEEKAKRILDFTQSKSNSHSAWLTFMYPRLYIAKQLLTNDGVIFISIDENEFAQLKLLCDEIFGEENFAGDIVWKNSSKNDQAYISMQHEYVLVYVKSKVYNVGKWKELKEGLQYIYKAFDALKKKYKNDWAKIHEEGLKWYNQFPDSNPIKDSKHYSWMDERGVYFPDNIAGPNHGQYVYDVIHPITGEICKPPASGWRFPEDKLKQKIKDKLVHFGKDHTVVPNNKTYLKNTEYQSLTSIKYKDGRVASNMLKNLFGVKNIFTNPKDTGVIVDFMKAIGVDSQDLVLDFFAGSGSTGEAVLRLNIEDGGNRKYILVQLPEKLDSKKKNEKVAFDYVKNVLKIQEPTIFEITKKRLLLASDKIKQETIASKIAEKEKGIEALNGKLNLDNKEEKIKQLKAEIENLKNQDLGFKIFETMPIWDDYDFQADELDTQLKIFDECTLTDEDIKALLITWKTYDGIPLTENPQKIDLGNYTGYFTKGKLYLMNKAFTTDNLKNLLEKIDTDKQFNPTTIVAFGYNFDSKNLREISENIKSYTNKKNIDIDFITRY
ncbi:MAG: site-specific DNA-methyltransferase [Bacilli bacterium]